MLNYADAAEEPPTLSGLAVEPLPVGAAGADFDVLFTLDWLGELLEADFTYSTELFSAQRAEAVVARFGQLLAELVAAPDAVLAVAEAAADRDLDVVGLASSFPMRTVEPTLRFWSQVLDEPGLSVRGAPAGQVRRPLLDADGPFRDTALDVVLLRWEDLLPGPVALPAAVVAWERALSDLAVAVAAHQSRTDTELVIGVCPASADYVGQRWAGVLGGLSDRLASFAATQPAVRVIAMDTWARRYDVTDPYPGHDGAAYTELFETVLATAVARLARRRHHPQVTAVAADPGAFGPELVAVLREQLGHSREVVLSAPPALPELAALVTVGAVRVGSPPPGAVTLDPARRAAHLWQLDAPATHPAEPAPLAADLLAELAEDLSTADSVAEAVRTGRRRSARGPVAAPRTDRERALAAIWAEVLHTADVGIHDDFYELGGDSLLAITVAFHAAEAGIALSARQLTERRTIAELDLDRDTGAPAQVCTDLVAGQVPLAPAQLWWFEEVATTMDNPSWFNHPYYLDVLRPITVGDLGEAVRLLAEHHASLRLRFVRGEDGTLRQHHAEGPDAVPFVSHDLSGLTVAEQDEAMAELAATAQRTLDTAAGPMCRVLHFAPGPDRPDRVLIIAHHLVVDAISRDLLLGDLRTLCTQLGRGQQPSLPARTSAYSAWAQRLSTHDLTAQLPYWLGQTAAETTMVPPDHPDGVTTLAAGAMLSTTLTTAQTDGLHDVVRRLRVGVRDLIMWGVTEAVAARVGGRECLLATTGHGREDLFADIDLSRTTGWFQVMYPVLLRLPDGGDAASRAAHVAAQLAEVPDNGIGYGVLRYATTDAAVRAQLGKLVQPRIALNYMGNFGFDEVSQADDLFDVCDAPYGDTDDGVGRWPYDLDIGGVIVGGRLRLDVGYSTTVYTAETAQAFLDELCARLTGLIGPATASL